MIRHPDYTRARLAQMSNRLRALIHPETCAPDELLVGPAVGRIRLDEARRLDYRPAAIGERFGPLWATYWFRVGATVPAAWAGSRVDLLWDSASEATLWLDGEPAQGLNPHHQDAVLVERAEGGENVAFEVELACNGLFGRMDAPVDQLLQSGFCENLHPTPRLKKAEGGDSLEAATKLRYRVVRDRQR